MLQLVVPDERFLALETPKLRQLELTESGYFGGCDSVTVELWDSGTTSGCDPVTVELSDSLTFGSL